MGELVDGATTYEEMRFPTPDSDTRLWDVPDFEVFSGGRRMYWRAIEEGRGFDFALVEWVAGNPTERGDYFTEDSEYEYLAYGEARVDGVRHLWFGGLECGYWYCPDVKVLEELGQWLERMECEHCPACQRREREEPR